MKRKYARAAEDEPLVVTVERAASLLSVSPYTIRTWIAREKLPKVKLGAAVRIRMADILRMIEVKSKPSSVIPISVDESIREPRLAIDSESLTDSSTRKESER